MTTHQPPAQPVGKRTCFSCDRRLPADRFAGVHLGGKLVQQCDTCRAAQPDYLAELIAVSDDMNRVHARLNALMTSFRPAGGPMPDEWSDCYRAFQALHLATQLVHVARDNEQARREPVPYLPVSYAEVAEYLAGGS